MTVSITDLQQLPTLFLSHNLVFRGDLMPPFILVLEHGLYEAV
jgi:hypothetical protein